MKKAFIIHPFLFAIFPILFLFSRNVGQVSFSEILLPLTIVLCFTSLLLLSAKLILRDNKKVGIIVSIFLVLFFSYGHVHNLIASWQIGNFLIGRHRYLMLIWSMLFAFSAYFTIRTRRNLHNFVNISNFVAFSLVLISLINIGVYKLKTRNIWQNNVRSAQGEKTNVIGLGNPASLRDIYYIILDGYASSNTLKKVYNHDNRDFTDYLTKRGFYIAFKSRSNYASTLESLTSSLNMEYINYLNNVERGGAKDRNIAYQMLKNSRVMNFLKSKGYKFINFVSNYPVKTNPYADLEFNYGRINEFLRATIQMSMLKPVMKYFIVLDARRRTLCIFSKLAEIYKIEEPKFVFVHIVPPHPPYLFGANGKMVLKTNMIYAGNEWAKWSYKEKYVDQLIFINKKIKILMDEILSKSEVPPIIILQADHGPASTFDGVDSNQLNHPTENMLKERLRIFNAYYLPAGGDKLLYESISPVNTFRLIFNFYFGTNYELLSDQSYFSHDILSNNNYEFINITNRVRYD